MSIEEGYCPACGERRIMTCIKKDGSSYRFCKGGCGWTDKKIIFHLSKRFPEVHTEGTIYEDIRDGRKTSEWRDMSHYWVKRLFSGAHWDAESSDKQDLTQFLKVHRAWFVEGYPKGNLPRLEADIINVFYHPLSFQLEIQVANVKEIKQA